MHDFTTKNGRVFCRLVHKLGRTIFLLESTHEYAFGNTALRN